MSRDADEATPSAAFPVAADSSSQTEPQSRECVDRHVAIGAMDVKPSDVVVISLGVDLTPRANHRVGQLFVGKGKRFAPPPARVFEPPSSQIGASIFRSSAHGPSPSKPTRIGSRTDQPALEALICEIGFSMYPGSAEQQYAEHACEPDGDCRKQIEPPWISKREACNQDGRREQIREL